MTTKTGTMKNYFKLFETNYTSKPADLSKKLRQIPRKSVTDIANYLFDWFSSQFKDSAFFHLDKIKSECDYSENTVREALKILKQESILLVEKIDEKVYLILLNKPSNQKYVAGIKDGSIAIDNLYSTRSKKEGIFNRVCNGVKKILSAQPTEFKAQSTELLTQATESTAQPTEFYETSEPNINEDLKQVENTPIDSFYSLDIYNIDLHHSIESASDEDLLKIKNVEEENAEEIRKALKAGLEKSNDLAIEEKKVQIEKSNQEVLNSLDVPLFPPVAPTETNKIDDRIEEDEDARQVRELLETCTYVSIYTGQEENIEFDEKYIYEFTRKKSKKVTAFHVKACIEKFKKIPDLENPANYLYKMIENPDSSKTKKQLAEKIKKKNSLVNFLETLTGKREEIGENVLLTFIKRELYDTELEKFKLDVNEIKQRVYKAFQLYGEDFTRKYLPNVVKEVLV